MSKKLKSHRGAKKRFKITASGKIRSKKSGARHLLTKKNTSSKRKKKTLTTLTPTDAQLVKKLVPNL